MRPKPETVREAYGVILSRTEVPGFQDVPAAYRYTLKSPRVRDAADFSDEAEAYAAFEREVALCEWGSD